MKQQSIRCHLVVPTVLLALTSACGDSLTHPPDVHLAVLKSNGAGEPARQFRLNGSGVLAGQEFAPGFPGGKSDFDGRCSVPSDFVIRFTVEGEVEHLGPVEGTLEHCTQIDFGTGKSVMSDGIEVITAPHGHEIWATYRSLEVPERGFDEQVEFTGGTGRFAGAAGGGMARAMCVRATGACPVYELVGKITFGPSGAGS